MRLIDLEKVVFDYSGLAYIDPLDFRKTAEYFMRQLKEQPTIEPERKKGEWNFEEYPDGYYHSECSICGSWFKEDAFLNPYNFCPNCGSDMRAEP